MNLAVEYSRFSSIPNSQTESSPSSAAGSSRQPQQQQQQQQQQGKSSDGRFNCTVCKKSFGSEATWHSHQISAKHIAATKDAEKKSKGGSKKSGGGKGQGNNSNSNNLRNNKNATKGQADEEDPPEVTEALMSFRKVEKIVGENPNMAASVLWKIAKALWSFRQCQETAKVLALLIRVLSELQVGSSGSGLETGPTPPGTLTSTQISMTLYLSRLSMARLIVFQSLSLASQYYLDAIQGRWQIDPNDFQTMCEMVHTSSTTQLLEHCKQFLSSHTKTEKLMVAPVSGSATPTGAVAGSTAPVKKPSDPNLKLITILLESSSMLSQSTSGTISTKTKEGRALAETSLALLAMAFALTTASEDPQLISTPDILRKMALIYNKGLGSTYATAACLILAGEIILMPKNAVVNEKQEQGDRVVWDLFQALLLAMESGDFVRMQRAIHLLGSCDTSPLLDVQTIVEIAKAVISQDNDFLRNNAAYALEHLLLLVQETDVESVGAMILLCRHNTTAASQAMLHRVQHLVL
ncbi:hypothetical protein BG011_008463 [Mortierella polycephala]|uniref:C2H2-type domain-containing protein n=1 Tax=Mortierella polycephala TaxID=41804 RepID=A0A9P6QI67_9FUNG|nr:hypothetical protein BG011_008463 [Mortierella polycephala]